MIKESKFASILYQHTNKISKRKFKYIKKKKKIRNELFVSSFLKKT